MTTGRALQALDACRASYPTSMAVSRTCCPSRCPAVKLLVLELNDESKHLTSTWICILKLRYGKASATGSGATRGLVAHGLVPNLSHTAFRDAEPWEIKSQSPLTEQLSSCEIAVLGAQR